MLVLSRKKNESLIINDDIVVTVVEIRGDKVRLGIVHPKEASVHRQEVWEAIHKGATVASTLAKPESNETTCIGRGAVVKIAEGDCFDLLLPDGTSLKVKQTDRDFSILCDNGAVAYTKVTVA